MAVPATAPKRDSRRFSQKRTEIIKAAAHTFGRKGFHATTLEEIAAGLRVTKASLYYYFSTKEELLFAVLRLSLEDLLRRGDEVLENETSPAAQLQAVILEHLRLMASDYEGAFLLQQEYELPQNYRDEIVRLRDCYEQKVLDIVREGVRQRVFRVHDARITVRMMLGAMNWFLRWYRAGGRLTVDEIADAYIDSIFYGLLAPNPPSASRPPHASHARRARPRRSRR